MTQHVFRSYDRAALDAQYNARETVPDFDAEMDRYRTASDAAKRQIAHQTMTYDPRSGETLDFYPAQPGAPLFVWIHGGYWRALSKDDNAFAAIGLHARGFHVAVVDYTLVPAANLDEIVRQVRTAIAFLVSNRQRLDIGPGSIAVGGSSAGGHLVGMLLADGWHADFGVSTDTIGAGLALSGLHDLQPLRHTYVNGFMQLDDTSIARNSPIRHIPHDSSAILLAAAGGDETAEFRRQTHDYADAWRGAGNLARVIDMPGFHHFDIALDLQNPESPLVDAVVESCHPTRAALRPTAEQGPR